MTKFRDRNFRFHIITGIVIAGVAIVLYQSALDYPFIFDDSQNIVENPNIRVTALDAQSLASVLRAQHPTPRPVAYLSFAVNYRFSGYAPRWYRVINIGIHVVNGVLVYIFCLLILIRVHGRRPSQSNRWDRTTDDAVHRLPSKVHPYFLAAAVSIIWTVHPLQTQSVTYIVQRMNSLAALFFLSAVCLYLAGRLAGRRMLSWSCFGGVVIAWGLALGSKQIAITLPAVLLLIEWFFFQDLDRAWLLRSVKYWLIPLAVAGLVAVIYLKMKPIANILAAYELREFTMWERVLTQFRVIILYFTLLIYPHPGRLNLDHHVLASKSVVEPISTLTSIIIIAGLLYLSIVIARRHRLASFCILWFFINLALESSIIGLEMVHEHRMYLPSVGCVLGLLYLGHFLTPRRLAVRIPLAAAVIALLALATFQRNRVWQSSEILWRDCVAKSPDKARPHYNLGLLMSKTNRLDEARRLQERALELDPDYADAHNNLGYILVEQNAYARAIPHFGEALRLRPTMSDARLNMGSVLAKAGRHDESIDHFRKAVEFDRRNADALYNLGTALVNVGHAEEAVQYLTKAVNIRPKFTEAHVGIGNALSQMGEFEQAITFYGHAINADPTDPTARNNLGIAQARRRRYGEAAESFAKAVELDSHFADAHYNLGNALRDQGKTEKAIESYRRASALNPANSKAHFQIGRLHMRQERYEAAIECFRRAVQIKPDYVKALDQLGSACLRLDREAEASTHWQRAVELRPDDAGLHSNLGHASLKQGDHAAAVKHYEAALAINPNLPVIHNNIAAAFIHSGRIDKAVEHYRAALDINPGYGDARDNLDQALQMLKQEQN